MGDWLVAALRRVIGERSLQARVSRGLGHVRGASGGDPSQRRCTGPEMGVRLCVSGTAKTQHARSAGESGGGEAGGEVTWG